MRSEWVHELGGLGWVSSYVSSEKKGSDDGVRRWSLSGECNAWAANSLLSADGRVDGQTHVGL
ncbi:hypothetical protein DACRYDRAFT_22834 [Dacryopinax primogenitus]|uniref:Uncharacterized protein n=1 Tax=Dacryopinax primogenitus (strain DJM 731) TaxID=1858805 RepID=M5FTN2_DACPD|nr:uncharacterized protein DACRYDRAFT_22834 [Dacryopinax primogenitus]EJU01011.1 hypothetical protein DACRYDRAFT_22834 [Dacryopinax primogenitus]